MPHAVYIFLALFAVAVPAFVLTPLVRSWWRWRGERQVSCPRDLQTARVKVDELGAAFHETYGEPGPILKACSRWPEREGCGQECLTQITPRGRETREWRNPRPERPSGRRRPAGPLTPFFLSGGVHQGQKDIKDPKDVKD